MTRLLRVAVFGLSFGACVGCRKGADASGGAASSGGPNGPPGAGSVTGGAPAATGTPAANTAGLAASGQGVAQGQPCEDAKCAAGLECITYYGIAGPGGPKFTSCEIRCDAVSGKGCPSGQKCVTISDGPGSVCRPPNM